MDRRKIIISSISMITITILIAIALIVFASANVSGITGKIGNGRMILNIEQGEKLEKYIQVINDNNVSVNISVFTATTQNQNMSIEILDKNFILNPGEDKRVIFIITSEEVGKYEGKINIAFKQVDVNESGVGLSSQIILNVYKKGTLNNNNNNNNNNNSDNIGGEIINYINYIEENNVINEPIGLLIGSTAILVIAVLVLLYLARRKSKNRGEHEKVIQQITKK